MGGSTAWRRVRLPLVVGVSTLAAGAYVWAVDPNVPGHYPLCPTKYVLGLDCPGCGGLRATHALLHGDVGTALDHNLLLVVLAPLAFVAWAAWLYTSARDMSPRLSTALGRHSVIAGRLLAILLVLFTVVRNVVPYLGSAAT